MGVKCTQCGKVWALRKPDDDGIFRCVKHTTQADVQARVRASMSGRKNGFLLSSERIDNRDKILNFLSYHARSAGPKEAAGIAKAMIAAVQMVDPMAPEQELGSFTVNIVSVLNPPPPPAPRQQIEPPEQHPASDAE